MDTGLSSCLELNDLDSGSTSPPPAPSVETRKPTDQEKQLASKASHSYFTKKNYPEALTILESLVALRPLDPRVSGNLAVVRFLVEGGGFNQLGKLQNDLKNTYMNILSGNGPEFEESELPVLIYNLGLCAFLQKKFTTSEKLLQQVHSALTSFSSSPPSPPSSPSQNCLTFKFRNLLPLLIAVSLHLNKPTQALTYLAEADTMAKQLDEDGSFSNRSLLLRAHALVLSKQHKVFKRDLKPAGLSPEQMTTYEFYRANLEYLKGNHKKATKLLALARQQPSDQALPQLDSMHENNLGCLHLMLSKPYLAVFYFNKSLQKHNEFLTELKQQEVVRKDAALQIKQAEIIYNLGMALLHSGQYEKAFQSFTNCLPLLQSNPSLWLHLAECCVGANKKNVAHDIKFFYGNGSSTRNDNNNNDQESPPKSVVASIGSGPNKKIVVRPTGLCAKSAPSSSAVDASATMSLDYAAQCLKNSLLLCGHPDIGEKPLISTSPKGNGNASSNNSSSQTSPVKMVYQIPRQYLLRGSILINSAYVALCLSNPVAALEFCEKLLDFNANGILPSGYKMLAHLYAAEALMQLNRISDATDHLDPSNIQDISFNDIAESTDESPGGIKKNLTDSMQAAKTVFQFNLIVAFALRGELENAETLLEKLWSENRDRDKFGIHLQMLSLRMYIQLSKGNVDRCRHLAQKHCNIVQQN